MLSPAPAEDSGKPGCAGLPQGLPRRRTSSSNQRFDDAFARAGARQRNRAPLLALDGPALTALWQALVPVALQPVIAGPW